MRCFWIDVACVTKDVVAYVSTQAFVSFKASAKDSQNYRSL